MLTVVIAFVLITHSRNEKADLAERESKAKDKATALLKVVERAPQRVNSLSDVYKERGLNLLNQADGGRGLLWLSRRLDSAASDDLQRQDAYVSCWQPGVYDTMICKQ